MGPTMQCWYLTSWTTMSRHFIYLQQETGKIWKIIIQNSNHIRKCFQFAAAVWVEMIVSFSLLAGGRPSRKGGSVLMSKTERLSLGPKKSVFDSESGGESLRLCVCGCIPTRPQPPQQICLRQEQAVIWCHITDDEGRSGSRQLTLLCLKTLF